MKDKSIVIAGAGICGLMLAWHLRKKYPSKPIFIFDNSSNIGGKYKTFNYDNNVKFDVGMHVIYESCISEIDVIYREILEEKDWNIYSDNEKDIAGLFFNNKLQNYSHYIDLRPFINDSKKNYVSDFFKNLNNITRKEPINAESFLIHQFGQKIYNDFHKQILRSMYGVIPKKLSNLAIKLSALERIILFDKDPVLELIKSKVIKNRIAYPDQLNLPFKRDNDQKALYPRKFGMDTFIDQFKKKLIKNNVKIILNAKLASIKTLKSQITNCSLQVNNSYIDLKVDQFISSVGWAPISGALNIKPMLKYDKNRNLIIVNLAFNQRVILEKLYYFYCYDKNFATFRVTNYGNYCPNANKENYYPISVELWPDKAGLNFDHMTEEDIIKLTISELHKFQIITKKHKLVFYKSEFFLNSLPTPTIRNFKNLEIIKNKILDRELNNLTVTGLLSEKNLFFLPDILKDAFEKIKFYA